jgi:hypothetical protein
VPPEYEPSLVALAELGELEYVDLVFPTVPQTREFIHHWMQFCADRDDIIEAHGNPDHFGYQTSGQQPMHLQIWFKKSAADDVRQLIHELEQLAAEADNNAQAAESGVHAGSP